MCVCVCVIEYEINRLQTTDLSAGLFANEYNVACGIVNRNVGDVEAA